SDPVLDADAFDRRLAKASLGIRAYMHAPDVIGVSEVENLGALQALADRKSTRLNSSHVKISYAVFCLKKKNADGPRMAQCSGGSTHIRLGVLSAARRPAATGRGRPQPAPAARTRPPPPPPALPASPGR